MNILIALIFLLLAHTVYAQECTQPSCFQQKDKELDGLAATTSAADRVPWFIDANGKMDLAPFTAYGRSLIGAANADAARTLLGVSVGGAAHVIENEGTPLTQRADMNFVGAGVTAADAGGKTVVTIPGGGHTVRDEGGDLAAQPNINFVGEGITCINDAGNSETECTVLGGHVVRNEGAPLTQRPNINFVGAGINCIDDAGGNETECTVATGAESDPVVGAINGIVKANGAGAISAAVVDVDYARADADTKALADNATSGLWARTGAGTGAARTITGIAGNIVVTNGDGVSSNPTIDVGTTVMQTDANSTLSSGTVIDAAAGHVVLPNSAGASPATNRIAIDTTADVVKVNVDGSVKTIATIDGNIATATALAANPAGCTLANGQWINDTDASGNPTCVVVIANGAADPSAGAVRFPGEIYVDTRAFDASTGAGRTYRGKAAAGNFTAIAEELDGWTTITDGIRTMSPSGSDTGTIRGANGIRPAVYNYTGTAFTNQPTNDGVEYLSDNAGDTTQFLRICGTTFGGVESDVTCEIKALNGTSQVSTTKTDWNNIVLAEICTTSACIANTIAAGTVTVREASGNATIVTLPNKTTYRSSMDLTLLTFSSTITKSASVSAAGLYGDGTQCPAAPTTVTINSGAPRSTFICADNDGSTLYGEFEMPDSWDGGTVTLMGRFVQTAADTANLNADVAMACRGDNATINNTWGTEIAMDTAMTGTNATDVATTAAITPNGTCTGSSRLLQFRWQMDATGTTTAVATLHVLGFKLEYGVSGVASD